ncbi:MAG: DUF1048 domain-containing protein [Lachnospiraceae bacterium]|nr:DUF1048 domain-containing protein [Lachnospiraceae bacterium]
MTSYFIGKEKLLGEYRDTFEKIETYSMLHGFDEDTDNEMMMNMLDILYTAQVNNKPVEKIIGSDIEQFCKDYFSECNKSEPILRRLPQFLYSISVLILILSIIEIIFPEEENIPVTEATVNVNSILVGMICGIVVSLVIGYIGEKILFKLKKIKANLMAIIIFVIFASACISATIITVDETVNIKLLPAVVISSIYVLVYKICRLFGRYKKYGSIKKPVKENSLKQIWNESFKEGMEEQKGQIAIILKKQYEKKNAKLRKKGKEEITSQEYMEWLHKRNINYSRIYKYILSIGYMIIYVVTLIVIFEGGNFIEFAIDALVLFIILFICYRLCIKVTKLYDMQNEFISKCNEDGITIIELAEKAEKEKSNKDYDGKTL